MTTRIRVLIVDDSRMIRDVLTDILQHSPGTASNGEPSTLSRDAEVAKR